MNPAEIPAEIQLPGKVAHAELVADRRGSRIWRVELEGVELEGSRLIALKYATNNSEAQGIQGSAHLLAGREAAVLRHIDTQGYLYASGQTAAGTWVALRWLDAPSLAKRWQAFRDEGTTTGMISAAITTWLASDALKNLHASGWRHGDLQAAHILIPDNGSAHLIDFALAQGPADTPVTPHVPYRGALAHLTAPEIARQILDTPEDEHVELSFEAEVYMFGAVVFAVWTKQWPRNYPTDPRQLSLPQIYQHICAPDSLRRPPEGWPDMAKLIESMLESNPDNRPTMAQVQENLTQQVSGRT
jgi:serine/threonine protein kinase